MSKTTFETCQYSAEVVKAVDRTNRTIEVVVSDDSLDHQGHRVEQAGLDFTQFKRNPVILACHDDRSFAVAKGLPDTIRVVGNQTRMTIQFPEEGNVPESDIAFYLYANGFMSAVSIGIQLLNWEMGEEQDSDGETLPVMLIHKCSVFEVSLVAVPANDNALALRAKKLNVELEPILQKSLKLSEMLRVRKDAAQEKKEEPVAQEIPAAAVPAVESSASEPAKPEEGKPQEEIEQEKTLGQDYIIKCVSYYERKQPANKASTKALEKFFKSVGEKQPAEEVAAWNRMHELIGKAAVKKSDEPVVVDPVPVAPAETAPLAPEAEAPKEEVAPQTITPPVETIPPAEPKVEEKEEPAVEVSAPASAEPSPMPSNPAPTVEEAPLPERKSAAAPRTVRISVAALRALPRVLGEAYAHSAVEALRRGEPVKDLDGVLDATERMLLASLTHS